MLQPILNRASRIAMIGLIITCIAGCSVKIGYGFLDTYIVWKIEQYISLDDSQEKHIKKAVDDFHAWHQSTQLTLYANYLETLKFGLQNPPVSGQFLHDESDKLQVLLDHSFEYLLPDLAQLASTLTQTQLQELHKNLEKERKDYRKKNIDVSAAKLKKRRIKDVTRYLNPFFGRYTDEQNTLLSDWEAALIPFEHLMPEQQRQLEKYFIETMEFQKNPDTLIPRLRGLAFYRTDNWNKELKTKLDLNQEATFVMLAKLFNSQTPKQQLKLERKFDSTIKDLRELAAKANPK